MVAAWIRAETGVGPSIASGSQMYNGICARFAGCADEQQQRRQAEQAEVLLHAEARRPQRLIDVGELSESVIWKRRNIPRDEARVADAVDDEAFLPASPADCLIEVKADQQVAAQADTFPADEQQRVVV